MKAIQLVSQLVEHIACCTSFYLFVIDDGKRFLLNFQYAYTNESVEYKIDRGFYMENIRSLVGIGKEKLRMPSATEVIPQGYSPIGKADLKREFIKARESRVVKNELELIGK